MSTIALEVIRKYVSAGGTIYPYVSCDNMVSKDCTNCPINHVTSTCKTYLVKLLHKVDLSIPATERRNTFGTRALRVEERVTAYYPELLL